MLIIWAVLIGIVESVVGAWGLMIVAGIVRAHWIPILLPLDFGTSFSIAVTMAAFGVLKSILSAAAGGGD